MEIGDDKLAPDLEHMTGQSAPSRPWWRRATRSPWFHLVAAFVVVGLILSLVAKPYLVPSGSMESTLEPGDRILTNRLAYVFDGPRSGDIIVFDADATWGQSATPAGNPLRSALRWIGEVSGFGPSGSHTLVKRVIGTPGDVVACCDAEGAVTVNGESLDEPYIFEDFPFVPGSLDCTTTARSARCFDDVTVPEDSYLVLGDHRSASSDSAAQCRISSATPDCWRWATRSGVIGSAAAILWPLSRWRIL